MPIHSLEDMSSDAYTEAWLPGPQATQFYTRTYFAASPKAVIVFLHGFAEHVGRYTQEHPEFAAHGFTVFTFDQRGFGRTALDAEHKSKSSAYAKTSGEDQMEDVVWAVEHARTTFPGLPVFLVGHSMGGGETMNFAIRRPETAALLSGAIGCSPFVLQAKPASKVQRWVGGKAAVVLPYMTIPAPLDFAVGAFFFLKNLKIPLIQCGQCRPFRTTWCSTRSPAQIRSESSRGRCAAFQICSTGSARSIFNIPVCADVVRQGEELLADNYKKWPKALPVGGLHLSPTGRSDFNAGPIPSWKG
jgi:pimeloyl-ACP methyl ester carboxylesterase